MSMDAQILKSNNLTCHPDLFCCEDISIIGFLFIFFVHVVHNFECGQCNKNGCCPSNNNHKNECCIYFSQKYFESIDKCLSWRHNKRNNVIGIIQRSTHFICGKIICKNVAKKEQPDVIYYGKPHWVIGSQTHNKLSHKYIEITQLLWNILESIFFGARTHTHDKNREAKMRMAKYRIASLRRSIWAELDYTWILHYYRTCMKRINIRRIETSEHVCVAANISSSYD